MTTLQSEILAAQRRCNQQETGCQMTAYIETNLDTGQQSPRFEFMTLAILYGICAGWVRAETKVVS